MAESEFIKKNRWRLEQAKRGLAASEGKWKHYLPAVVAFFAAWMFMRFPVLAAMLVSGVLVFFAVLYAFIVFQVHRTRAQMEAASDMYSGDGFQGDFKREESGVWSSDVGEPNFKNVSIKITRLSGLKD